MKRFLLSLVAIVITSLCFAQDIIVLKDGSTIQAKVTKVTQSVVEYKKFNNQNGPDFSISTTDLQCINYENGTKDTFVSPNYNPNIVTNETASQFSNDKELLDIYHNLNKKEKTPKIKKEVTPEMLYKRGKRMKTIGYAVGGTLLVGGIVTMIVGATKDKYYESLSTYNNRIDHHKYFKGSDVTQYYPIGAAAMIGGVAVAVPLLLKGSSLQKKSREQINSVSAISQDIHFNNGSNLNLGIDLLSNNYSYTKTPGIGIRYNF